jgi:hypothetical protein
MTVDAVVAPTERDAEVVTLSTGARRFHDSQVRKVAGWVDASPLIERVESWKREASKAAGRPETFPLRALLIVMLLGAISHQPLLASTFTEIMFLQISPTMRAELGIPEPQTPYSTGSVGHKSREHKALYRNVRTRLKGLLALMDPSPLPKDRRLDHDAFALAVAQRRQVLCNEDLALRYDRLSWFVNELIEASLRLLPRHIWRRWLGSVAVDATAVRAFARPSRPRHGQKRWSAQDHIEIFSADADAGMYIRKSGAGTDDDALGGTRKSWWAYEATFVIAGSDDPGTPAAFPNLIVGMPPLHPPGREPGLNAVRALRSIHDRGHPRGWLAGDRAYTDAQPGNFALPARALGYRPVLDYAEDHLGIKGEHGGFLFIEGAWYCPAIPTALVNASIDFANKTIDEPTYRARLAERWRHVAVAKAAEDAQGFGRWRCPAAEPHPLAACPLKPASQRHDGQVRVSIRPSGPLKANPPRCCTQGSVTMGPEPMAKLRQDLFFQSAEWNDRYHTLRATIEGMNGYLKDGAREALDDPQRRRIRGVAAQSLFVALLVFAGNYRKIQEFMKLETGDDGPGRRRPRRRLGKPISDWYPEPTSELHRPKTSDST